VGEDDDPVLIVSIRVVGTMHMMNVSQLANCSISASGGAGIGCVHFWWCSLRSASWFPVWKPLVWPSLTIVGNESVVVVYFLKILCGDRTSSG
jgi:hypothetical protein